MEKIKIKQVEVSPILDINFYNKHSMEKLISLLDQDLYNHCNNKYDDVQKIINEGVTLIIESSLEGLRFSDKQLNDAVFAYEHQVKEFMFIWDGLENDTVPFKEGHTYHQKYNLGFGDHIISGGLDQWSKVKQKPKNLYFYLENGIVGRYDIKFYNGVEFTFTINEKEGIVDTRAWLEKKYLTDKSIIPTFVLLRTFYKLGLRPTKHKEVYKLLRNVMKVTYKLLVQDAKNGRN